MGNHRHPPADSQNERRRSAKLARADAPAHCRRLAHLPDRKTHAVELQDLNGLSFALTDDFIVGFEHEADARRFLDEMRERLQKFALSLHSEKTRLIEFGRLAAANRKRRGLGKPETFTFLGFTFICSKTRRGKFQIKRKSRRDRMQAKLQAIKQELRRSMHQPIPQQGRWLQQVVTGYFNYHAVPTNSSTLTAFLFHVTNLWRRTLRWRSQKDGMTWERIKRLADHWLPKPRILHPWPERRFAVRHPRWEPCARIGLARICAGARGNSRPYRESRFPAWSGRLLTLPANEPPLS